MFSKYNIILENITMYCCISPNQQLTEINNIVGMEMDINGY